jgi:hypothetical protein
VSAQEVEDVGVSREECARKVSCEAPACMHCGLREHTSLFDGFDPDIVRCNSCGLILNATMPCDQELASIYGECYYGSKESLRYGWTNYLADRDNIVRMSRGTFATSERLKCGSPLLDVGCACGCLWRRFPSPRLVTRRFVWPTGPRRCTTWGKAELSDISLRTGR